MLEVQKFIKDNGIAALKTLGIKVVEEENYILLNYDQIESPKMHPVVMECRGLILDKHTLRVACKPFTRFFNYGEADEITKNFNWKSFGAYEKLDGSLAPVWYDFYKSEWRFNTRGSFGDAELVMGKSWSQVMRSCISDEILGKMSANDSYIFEFVSPFNKIVRDYKKPEMILLGMYNNTDGYDYPYENIKQFAGYLGIKVVDEFDIKSLDELKAFIKEQETDDPTFEGCVLRDNNGLRIKVKSTTYVALHQMKGNGNIFLPKNILPFILAGETEEVLNYFPEAKEIVDLVDKEIKTMYDQLHNVWFMCQDFEEQKKFALYVTKENPTPFSGILFRMKQDGTLGDEAELKKRFRDSKELILKQMKD